ncbi:MAG: trigger factor [Chitinispirillia bacterium]|nr:trigger factor [Chitinispirillia bacterium]MCL2268026.1 trigger factor [Chitinispirillia bacterium]
MKTTVSTPETWKRVIEFEVPAADFSAAVDAKLAEYRRDARLPGFRQGKVPLSVIKQRFGEAAKAAVIEEIVKDSYKAACEEHKIEPVTGATMTDMKELADGEPLRFTLETEVDPPVEVAGYDKLKVKAKPAKVKDSDVDDNFTHFVERFAEYKDVDRAAKKGDSVRIEYRSVTIDGQERPDLKNHNPGYPIELGAEGGIKEFDKGLTGVSAGDETDITVKFPKDYADPGAAGKDGVFAVKVLAVQEKHLPELNGEFLSKFGDFSTVDALKAEMRKGMEEEALGAAKREAHNEAVDILIKDNPFDVPPSKVEAFINMMIEDYAQQQNGQISEPREELAERFHDAAVMALKRIRIIEYISDREKIKATQEEVDGEIELMAQRYGHDFDQLKQMFRKNGTTNRIRLEIRERKTLDFLIGEAAA